MSITYRRCFPFPFVIKFSYCIGFRQPAPDPLHRKSLWLADLWHAY